MFPVKRVFALALEFDKLYNTTGLIAINPTEVVVTHETLVELSHPAFWHWTETACSFHANVLLEGLFFTAVFRTCDEIREIGVDPTRLEDYPLIGEKERADG